MSKESSFVEKIKIDVPSLLEEKILNLSAYDLMMLAYKDKKTKKLIKDSEEIRDLLSKKHNIESFADIKSFMFFIDKKEKYFIELIKNELWDDVNDYLNKNKPLGKNVILYAIETDDSKILKFVLNKNPEIPSQALYLYMQRHDINLDIVELFLNNNAKIIYECIVTMLKDTLSYYTSYNHTHEVTLQHNRKFDIVKKMLKRTSYNNAILIPIFIKYDKIVDFLVKQKSVKITINIIQFVIENILDVKEIKTILKYVDKEYIRKNIDKMVNYAINYDKIDVVSYLLTYKFNINKNVSLTACENGNLEIFNLLVKNKVPIHQDCIKTLCIYEYVDMAKILIKEKINIEKKAIYYSVKYNQEDILKMLLENFDPVKIKDILIVSMYEAIRNKNINICKLLGSILKLDHAAYLNIACYMGNLEICKLLVDLKCPYDKDTIKIAVDNDYNDIIELLMDCKTCKIVPYDLNDMVVTAIKNNNEKMLISVCKKTKPQGMCFEIAVKEGNLKICKILLKYGCPFTIFVVHIAVKTGNYEIVKLLLEYNAYFSTRSIYVAFENGDTKLLKLLLNAKTRDKNNNFITHRNNTININSDEIIKSCIDNDNDLTDNLKLLINYNLLTSTNFDLYKIIDNLNYVELLIQNGWLLLNATYKRLVLDKDVEAIKLLIKYNTLIRYEEIDISQNNNTVPLEILNLLENALS